MANDGGKLFGLAAIRDALKLGRPTFKAKTAQDDAARLTRRFSFSSPNDAEDNPSNQANNAQPSGYESVNDRLDPPTNRYPSSRSSLGGLFNGITQYLQPRAWIDRGRKRATNDWSGDGLDGEASATTPLIDKSRRIPDLPKVGSLSRPAGESEKLGTFSGVFVPTSLNVLSILMFLRFGFILGQSGFIGMMGMLVVAYCINLVTTLSISAIASNGTVRGGGAYYLISRSLGAEFGGSIGLVFYLGFVFNTGMNAVGLVDCLFQNFGKLSGDWYKFLPEGTLGWSYLWSTAVLVLCTIICLAGSSLFARCSNALLVILLIATFSIPISAIFLNPFTDENSGVEFTGLSLQTLMENLKPHFTRDAAGSQIEGRENYQDLFGILFPATGGIFAGASMSGDLRNPSKSIPRGTLYGLALTFFAYTIVILSMAASITRASLYRNTNVITETNISGLLVFLGEISTSLFSTLMGVIGPAKLLQAIARDKIFPGLGIFAQGTKKNDEPIYAIIFTFLISQVTILFDLNRLASFITMTYLMTFLATNLACFLLEIAAAPNFRPSFHYFNRWTAAAGTIVSGASMFFVDGLYAAGCIGVLLVLFGVIHFTASPRSWGDVSQALIYHQVRKYLLRLREEHVKFWRPQILLFINDPRRSYKLIQFCNSLKKGSLFLIGHIIVTPDFGSAVPEARKQQSAWTKYIELSRIKAFVNIAIAPGIEWGARNIALTAGLGGMRPNIVVLGFYNLDSYRMSQSIPNIAADLPGTWNLNAIHQEQESSQATKRLSLGGPTETYRSEGLQNITSYLEMLEDLLLKLRSNVAVAKGFTSLEIPDPHGRNQKKYIDLWPIQMSAEFSGEGNQSVFTTNFDTYTLVLQLGAILETVPSYKKAYTLRVAVFVEYEAEVESEKARVSSLLEILRIQAEVLVFWLASGDIASYQVIVNDVDDVAPDTAHHVEAVLGDEEWWEAIKKFRGSVSDPSTGVAERINYAENFLNNTPSWPESSFQQGKNVERFEGLRRLVNRAKRRRSMSSFSAIGVSLGMKTHHLRDDFLDFHSNESDESDLSDSELDHFGRQSDDDSNAVYSDDDFNDLNNSGNSRAMSPSSLGSDGSKSGSKRSSKGRKPRRKSLRQVATLRSANSSNVTSPRLRPVASDSGLTRTRSRQMAELGDDDFPRLRNPHRNLGDEAVVGDSEQPSAANQDDDGQETVPGPSIMFSNLPVPQREGSGDNIAPESSIYSKKAGQPSTRASGFPSAASVPLSFNDLPCRAQHLILNELMLKHSKDTAVIFTTLPAPLDGTHKSESDSLTYLTDIEVLTKDLPPTLLIHSNSMTVTTNL